MSDFDLPENLPIDEETQELAQRAVYEVNKSMLENRQKSGTQFTLYDILRYDEVIAVKRWREAGESFKYSFQIKVTRYGGQLLLLSISVQINPLVRQFELSTWGFTKF